MDKVIKTQPVDKSLYIITKVTRNDNKTCVRIIEPYEFITEKYGSSDDDVCCIINDILYFISDEESLTVHGLNYEQMCEIADRQKYGQSN